MQNSGFWRAKGWVLKSQNIFTVSYLPYHQSDDSLIAVCNSDVAAVRSSLYCWRFSAAFQDRTEAMA